MSQRLFATPLSQNYQALKYYRHDPPGMKTEDILSRVKSYPTAGHPAMFGFTVYNSIEQADKTGRIPFSSSKEKVEGGHAVVAVGYDDKITNRFGKIAMVGTIPIRNSWGAGRGKRGTDGCLMSIYQKVLPKTSGPY